MKNKIIFIFLIVCSLSFFITVNAQTIDSGDASNCVVCTQSIPQCGPDEEVALQTCEACAHCVQKLNPPSGEPLCSPCGDKCCKVGRNCVLIDRCKGKPSCKKPIKGKCVSAR